MREDKRTDFDDRYEPDERVDAALRRYANAPHFSEPRVALARVRALAEQEPERRPRRVWTWVVPSVIAAALMVVVALWVMRTPQTPQIAWAPKTPGVANVEHSESTNVSPIQKATAGHSTRDANHCCVERHAAAIRTLAQNDRAVRVRVSEHLPKQEVFPTPQPLSPEERALLALATQAPPEVRKQVIEAQKHFGDPIQIAALAIRPLDEAQQSEPERKDPR